MDPENDKRSIGENFAKGLVCKSASVESQEVTEEDLKKINKFTLSPLKADEVFVFKVIMGDNELDDRNFEPFNLNALKDLKKLYIGKTMIKDHRRTADNQIARVYEKPLSINWPSASKGSTFAKYISSNFSYDTFSGS